MSRPAPPLSPKRPLLLGWLASAVVLCAFLGTAPVQRTQEARVLETAREMVGSGWQQWIIPRLNGAIRVRKPPLAYWMAAAGFELGGVSDAAGRAATVICGWLTIGLTYQAGAWLFGRRAGIFAAACLTCSFLFYVNDRYAETDAPTALFVTAAIYFWWQAIESPPAANRRATGMLYAGAAATALAVMAKGPPGAYPFLFFIFMTMWTRRRDMLRRLFLGGPILVCIILAAPWWMYVLHTVGIKQFTNEIDELAGGEDHLGHFYQYFPDLLRAAAPWSLVLMAAIATAIGSALRRFGKGRGKRTWPLPQRRRIGVLIWCAVILIPLCIIRNKQPHYLLPMMPPVMLLTGWWLDRALRVGTAARLAGFVIDATMIASAAIVPAMLWASRHFFGAIRHNDKILAGFAAGLLFVVFLLRWNRGRTAAVWAYLVGCMILFPLLVGSWLPDLQPDDSRAIARQIRDTFGDGPYVAYGPNVSLALCFNLRSEIPVAHTAGQLLKDIAAEPDLVVIVQSKSQSATAPALPATYDVVYEITTRTRKFDLYRGLHPHP